MYVGQVCFSCAGILKLALGAAEDAFDGVVEGVPWQRVLGAAEGAFGEMVEGVPSERVLGAAEGAFGEMVEGVPWERVLGAAESPRRAPIKRSNHPPCC